MTSESSLLRSEGRRIAFVPTMGFFHEGHLSLMREAKRRAERTVVSVFVNPTQFAPGEDLESYPRNFDRDERLARNEGVDIMFAPEADDMYSEKFQTVVELKPLTGHLCGISRPAHFRGVATIVAKLFNIVKPHVAVFGEKDFQQIVIMRQMARDLNFDVEIVGAPIVRERSGLAMSSRNVALSPEQRISALTLGEALKKAHEMIERGITNSSEIIKAGREIIESQPDNLIDYISICDPETLVDVERIEKPSLMALAVRVGKTRLIDNAFLCANRPCKINRDQYNRNARRLKIEAGSINRRRS